MKEFPKKFLSLRDKNGTHRRNRSLPPKDPANKPRPLSAEAFMSLFKTDHPKQSAKAEKENDSAKIEDVRKRLDELNITHVTNDHIIDIMATKFADGDPERTAQFIDIEQKAASGVIMPYDRSVEMVGAENRGNVTCYLDALLFSMFAKLDAFECMLKNEFPADDSRNRLVNLLRIWVNMLRTGKLVHNDLTKLIQDALADSGWSDARMLEQQDTSEAFAFITETLQLPLLSLQVDLFHQGKKDKDDHKVVYERLLNLAVPPDPEDKGIKLEDCLEEYFNAQVDVQRDSEEAKKSAIEDLARARSWSETPTLRHRDTIRLITEEQGEGSSTVTASPVSISPTHQEFPAAGPSPPPNDGATPDETTDSTPAKPAPTPIQTQSTRHRSTSVIQRVVLDEQGRPSSTDNITMLQKAMRKGSTVVKAVTIPAWQFFRLIPWHAVTSSEPRNDMEVAMNFDQRPVVGICLKRYAMTESGHPKRHNTFIDIPDSLRLPHFMMADGPKAEEDPNVLNMEYKLVLQSVICHRGDSLQSGHYISFARVAPKLLTDNRRHDFDPPPDYEEAQWVKFDDLQLDSRVTYVDDIKQSLKDEMPYLLFYQIVPMVDVAAASESTETEPPSYNESKVSIELPPTPSRVEMSQLGLLSQEGYFDATPTAESVRRSQSKPPSIRLSSDSERLPRRSAESMSREPFLGSLLGDSRRPSVFTDSTTNTPAITPNSHSPAITPSEESTASRLSRAASRFTKVNRSRPSSQSGEGRISFSMTRLGGLMRPSKEPLNEQNALGISSTNSTGPLTSESSKEKEGNESPPQPAADAEHGQHHHHHHKHSHKRIRSKEKVGKNKSESQPERECVVM